MKSLFVFTAALAAVLAAGAGVRAQHGHGHFHGHPHGFGYAGPGHAFGYGYGGHVHGHVHGHLHALPFGGYYGSYGVGYPYTSGSSWSYPAPYAYPVVAAPVVQSAVPVAPVDIAPAGGAVTTTSFKPNAIPAYTGPGVTLRLPAEVPEPVYLQVDKREVEMRPGTEVVLRDKGAYLIEFDRGGEFGTASSEIAEGAYKFAVGDRGWQLVPDAVAPAGGLRRNSLPGEPKK